jgi:hypothetical protein
MRATVHDVVRRRGSLYAKQIVCATRPTPSITTPTMCVGRDPPLVRVTNADAHAAMSPIGMFSKSLARILVHLLREAAGVCRWCADGVPIKCACGVQMWRADQVCMWCADVATWPCCILAEARKRPQDRQPFNAGKCLRLTSNTWLGKCVLMHVRQVNERQRAHLIKNRLVPSGK